jgi:hypothetical protein
MNKVILEKIPGINNVGKSSLITGTFKDINRIILERNTMYVCNVGKPCLSNFQRYEGTHWEEFPSEFFTVVGLKLRACIELLYQSFFVMGYLRGFHKLFAPAGLKLRSS